MPPKKKIVDENADDPDRSLLSVEDFNLPKSMILRLTKGVLPPNTSVQKDALTAILKSTTLFVNYLASNADDRAQLANKKTIRPEDVFGALEEIEFGHFRARVEQELSKYQEIQNHKRNDYRRRMKEDPKPTEAEGGGDGNENEDGETISDYARDKSTTPLVVTLGNGDQDRERERSSLRYGVGRDDTETEADDEPPAAKKVRRSLADDGTNGRDEDDTLSDVDVNDEVEEDEEEEDLIDEDDDVEVEDEVVDEDPEELGGLTDVDSDNNDMGRRRNGADGLNPNPDDDDNDDDSGPE